MIFGPFKFSAKDKESEENSIEYVRSDFLCHLSSGWECELSFHRDETGKYISYNVQGFFRWVGEGDKTDEDAKAEFKRIQELYTGAVLEKFLDNLGNGGIQLTSSFASRPHRDPESRLSGSEGRSFRMKGHA